MGFGFKINYRKSKAGSGVGFSFRIDCGSFRKIIFKIILDFNYKEATETRLNEILSIII